MKIHLISAARPNFMKIAPVYHTLMAEPWAEPLIVHTGQHYDINMSDSFFRDLNLPEPNIHLGIGSGTHAQQTGNVMIAYEKVLMDAPPDMVLVVGDVNSTMAATIAAVKIGIPVAHLEAGLRSFDRTMPEEINRLVTDAIADLLMTPSPDGDANLRNEGVAEHKIHRVGNVMIDSLEMLRSKIEAQEAYKEFGVASAEYGLVTLHRPSNVDGRDSLEKICIALNEISKEKLLVFPVHPRTRKKLEKYDLTSRLAENGRIVLTEPLNYIRFMSMVFNCAFVITDSGGVQEETTYLKIPCFTLRPNTERPITTTIGTNKLCKVDDIVDRVMETIFDDISYAVPDLWDGKTSQRVASVLKEFDEQSIRWRN